VHDTFGARRYLTEELTADRSIDRQTLDECDKLRKTNNQTLAEVLVSEGIVTDQQLGRLLEKFKNDGHISEPELNLLMNEFPANWERWKEMEERDTEKGIGVEKAEEAGAEAAQTMPSEALVEEKETPEKEADAKPEPPEELRKKPLTERVHRGTLQQALEELMDEAPVRDYAHEEAKPKEEAKAADDAMVGRKVGGATVLSKIDESGLGKVYKGVVESLGKTVAIRVIGLDHIKEPQRQRFMERANAASKIEHRNVASVITVGQEEDYIYLISRFVEGESLRSKLDKVRDLPQEESLDIALQVARALRAGHADGIFHGNIRPENIIFDEEGQPTILDFGLHRGAEIVGEGDSRELQLLGSPKYMAPEQFEARMPDARTDIYILGIVLYEMLCGKVPFTGPTMFAVRDAHYAGRPKPLTEINPEVNTTLGKLVAKMISKDPGDRYQDITELVNDMLDLKQYLASGGTVPQISGPAAAGAPQFDAEVQARAQRYKTVAITPESERKRGPFLKILFLILLLLVAAGAGIYHFRPDIRDRVKAYIFGEQQDDETEAAKVFEEIKRKADILLARQKFLDTLKILDSFPAKYATTIAGLNAESYKDKVFDEANKAFAEIKTKIDGFLDAGRVEEAMRKNNVLKAEVDQILGKYAGSSPGAKALGQYVSFYQETAAKIASRLEHVKNFEQDMKAVETLLKASEESKLDEAVAKIKPYLNSPISTHCERAEKLKKLIAERRKELQAQAEKDREKENFEKAKKDAKDDMAAGRYDLALSRIKPFRDSEDQEIVLDAIREEIQIKKKREESLFTTARNALVAIFMADLNKGIELLKEGQYKETLAIVKKYEDGKYLTEAQRAAFSRLAEEEKGNIASLSEKQEEALAGVTGEQLQAFTGLTEAQKTAFAKLTEEQKANIVGLTDEQIEATPNLSREQKNAIVSLTPQERKVLAGVTQAHMEAISTLSGARARIFSRLNDKDRNSIAGLTERQRLTFSRLTEEEKDDAASLFPEQKEAVSSLTPAQVKAVLSLTEAQKTALAKLKEVQRKKLTELTRKDLGSVSGLDEDDRKAIMDLTPRQKKAMSGVRPEHMLAFLSLTESQKKLFSRLNEVESRDVANVRGEQRAALDHLMDEERNEIAGLPEEQKKAISRLTEAKKKAYVRLTAEEKRTLASLTDTRIEDIAGAVWKDVEAICNLTEKEKKDIYDLKAKAQHSLQFHADFEAIDKLIKQNKLRLARMRCARWRLDPDLNLRRQANRKYAEIMGAMEPGMAYIEGGTAIVGWNDSAEIVVARFDYDSDGKVGEDEFRGPHKLFTEMDANLDGFLAKGEFAIDKFDTDVDGRLSRKEFPVPDYIFTRLDTNEDRFITKDEMLVKEFDKNEDNALTVVEFAGYPDIYEKLDDNGDGFITREEALVKKLDANEDGKITREEFVLPAALFDAMDKDGDGVVTAGDDDKNPRRHEAYHNFYIDRHEVSCRDYEKFVLATDYSPPANWPGGKLPRQWHLRPVTGVTQKDAAEYAKWARKRLPTEAEWEIAASWDGEKKILYPWGGKYVKGSANIGTGSAWKVGTESKDVSPNGVHDMAGNVAEWTATAGKAGATFVVRGSSADRSADPVMARTTRRSLVPSENATDFIGFRCVKDLK
jgi:hypothetical protein